MEAWEVVLDLLILLMAALVLGTLAEQLHQSAILGYLLAGTLVGPNVFGFVHEGEHVEAIAELGAALLLFSIGLEFSFRRLARLRRVGLLGGTLQVAGTLALAAGVAALLGLPWRSALAVGAIVALSSTACVLRLLGDRAALESIYGRSAVGILLLQDVAVIPLILLMVMLTGATTAADAALLLGRTLFLAVVLVGGFLLIFNFVVPRLLNIERWSLNRELPILLAIVIAVGSTYAAHAAGLSPAMGAFVAGVLLGESVFAAQIRADVSSLRTLFVTIFFASIGMLGDPTWFISRWYLVTAVVVMVIIGKAAIVWGIVRLLGVSSALALATGLCIAQIGEFSFVLAQMARGTLIGSDAFNLIVSATIATLFLTPFLVAAAPRAADLIESRRRRGPVAPAAARPEPEPEKRPDIMIIGFGPAGQAVAHALYRRHRDRIAVLELNPRNTLAARRLGLEAHVGDATHHDVLEHAGFEHAAVVAVTIPDPRATRSIIHLCRHLAPGAVVIVRARYHVRRWELELAGAREVVDEEEHVGLRIAALARRHLAAAAAAEAERRQRPDRPAEEPEGNE